MENEKETIPELFGRNVRKYRKAAGLTQERLSEQLGITQKHLSILETGTQFASAPLIEKISDALKVSPGDLFGGTSGETRRQLADMQSVILSHISNEMNRLYAMLQSDISALGQKATLAEFF